MNLEPVQFRRNLFRWYRVQKRDLPWRRDRDPYRIWISEIMLQQTRVSAVIPYYDRFLRRFPNVEALASAEEQAVLAAWSGLGYYQRARNLQAAAKQIVLRGSFPRTYDEIRSLPGIGDYTAAAIASIALNVPRAAVDGNVIRVLSRVTAEPGDVAAVSVRLRLQETAGLLLDPRRPGEQNQAMMELGATLCLPRNPLCLLCPVAEQCEAHRTGRAHEFPIKRKRAANAIVLKQLVIVTDAKRNRILLWQRPPASRRMAGFWELPDPAQLSGARIERKLGDFRHTIVNTTYRFEVLAASLHSAPIGFAFMARKDIHELPLSTTAKKALACLDKQVGRETHS